MDKIARIDEVLEFLKNLIHSYDHDRVRIIKASLDEIRTYLKNA